MFLYDISGKEIFLGTVNIDNDWINLVETISQDEGVKSYNNIICRTEPSTYYNNIDVFQGTGSQVYNFYQAKDMVYRFIYDIICSLDVYCSGMDEDTPT